MVRPLSQNITAAQSSSSHSSSFAVAILAPKSSLRPRLRLGKGYAGSRLPRVARGAPWQSGLPCRARLSMPMHGNKTLAGAGLVRLRPALCPVLLARGVRRGGLPKATALKRRAQKAMRAGWAGVVGTETSAAASSIAEEVLVPNMLNSVRGIWHRSVLACRTPQGRRARARGDHELQGDEQAFTGEVRRLLWGVPWRALCCSTRMLTTPRRSARCTGPGSKTQPWRSGVVGRLRTDTGAVRPGRQAFHVEHDSPGRCMGTRPWDGGMGGTQAIQ